MSVNTTEEIGELSYENIKALFRRSDEPVLTAGEIASAFGVTNQAANYRLSNMIDNGVVESKDVGSAAVVYWLSE